MPQTSTKSLSTGQITRQITRKCRIKTDIETRPLQWYDLPPGSKNVLFKVTFTSQTSGSNNKLDIGTFKLGHPRLSNSKTNNKRDIGTFKFGHPRLTLNEGPKVKSDRIKRFPAHTFSYRLFSHPKPLGPIISEI